MVVDSNTLPPDQRVPPGAANNKLGKPITNIETFTDLQKLINQVNTIPACDGVLVISSAHWCPPCKALKKYLNDELEKVWPTLCVVILDVDTKSSNAPDCAARAVGDTWGFQVSAIPHGIMIEKGTLRKELVHNLSPQIFIDGSLKRLVTSKR